MIKDLIQKPLPQIPKEIADALEWNEITLTRFEEKNQILENENLHEEAGFRKMNNGSYLVSMYCPMPGVTVDMINWWFWWHPRQDERYRAWFPGSHFSVGYPKEQAAYFEQERCPAFQNNTQYPKENIGGMTMPLRIDFVEAEEFGFSKYIMQDHHIPLIVCGHVGAFKGLVCHTEMAHIFRQTEDGLFLISRFWMGETMKNPVLRKFILTDDLARGMAEHCCIEYRNLAEILPDLYFSNH